MPTKVFALSILQTHQYLSMPKPKSTAPAASSGGKQIHVVKQVVKVKAQKKKKSPALPAHVRLSVDPWNSQTEGSGRPDSNAEATIPWRETWSQTFTTDAQGNLYIEMMGSLNNCVYTKALTLVADPVVGAATHQPMPNLSTLTSTFSNYRPMVVAFEAEYIGEAQLCKGVLGVGRIATDLAGTETFSSLTDETFYKEVRAEEKVAARLILPENDFQATSGTAHAGKIFLMGIALPASLACVRVRFTAVYEMQVTHSSIMSRESTHTVAHPAQIATVSSIVGPKSVLATGPDPVADLIRHGEKLAVVAGAINGLWQAAKPYTALAAEFAGLLI